MKACNADNKIEDKCHRDSNRIGLLSELYHGTCETSDSLQYTLLALEAIDTHLNHGLLQINNKAEASEQ